MLNDVSHLKKSIIDDVELKKEFVEQLLLDRTLLLKINRLFLAHVNKFRKNLRIGYRTLMNSCRAVFNMEIKAKKITKKVKAKRGKRQANKIFYVLDALPHEKRALLMIEIAIKANDINDRNVAISDACKLLKEKLVVVNELFNADR